MKITLSLDEALVKKVRKIAVDRGTTLTGLALDYLEDLVAENDTSGRKRGEREALERSFERSNSKSEAELERVANFTTVFRFSMSL